MRGMKEQEGKVSDELEGRGTSAGQGLPSDPRSGTPQRPSSSPSHGRETGRGPENTGGKQKKQT